MNFFIGCNYWASNSGIEMWNTFDAAAIEDDLRILSEHGVTHMRVFPNWRDFQPVIPLYGCGGVLEEYRLVGDVHPQNPYYLDEEMLDRFSTFCDLCDKYGIRLIVGLLTGWMSGRLFIPAALNGKNLFTDPTALIFEQRFIRGFVTHFKERDTIMAWDLGNECNCLSPAATQDIATNWTATISNAIKAADPTRPVVSGMHGLSADSKSGRWTIKAQGEFTDILTTHPYPYFVPHASLDPICSYRTTMHASCETQLYADISGKPAFPEEIGNLGPNICSDENAADFLRCNLFSNFAHGSIGLMWWCANEQTNLNLPPHAWNAVETELGMIDKNRQPKPILKEMKRFSEFLQVIGTDLPKPTADAVCILTGEQDQWGVAYMTYCLARQAGLNLQFAFQTQPVLPKSDVYLLPSTCDINRECLEELKRRAKDGATLYISNNRAAFTELSDFAGITVQDSARASQSGSFTYGGITLPFEKARTCILKATGATVLATDEQGDPLITETAYGKGRVVFVNFPLEEMLLTKSHAFDQPYYTVYRSIFSPTLKNKVHSANPFVAVTEHHVGDTTYAVLINHSPVTQSAALLNSEVDTVIYGNPDTLPPFDAAVVTLK